MFLRLVHAAMLAMLTVTVTMTTPAQAAPVLDQSFIPPTDSHFIAGIFPPSFSGGRLDRSQTFTVGITGTLSQIDVFVFHPGTLDPGSLLMDVRATIGGVPSESDADVLAFGSLPSSSIPAGSPPLFHSFVSFDISAFALSVSAGDVLAITLRTLDSGFSWGGVSGDPYLGGQNFERHGPLGTWERPAPGTQIQGDYGFRTFVTPTPVPEPSSLLLAGMGIAVLLARRKRIVG